MAKKLTDRVVGQYKADPDKRLEIPDAGCAALYLVIQSNGSKSWAVRYRSPVEHGKPKKLTLGPVAAISLKRAHKLAKDALLEVERGNDPAMAKRDALQEAKADAIAARDNTVDAAM